MKKIKYYFDFLSPFSYFSWLKTHALRENPEYSFDLKPVAMGSVFNHWGIKGPGEIAPKRIYMLKQCFEYAAFYKIKFIPPKQHPFNPLYALRLATSSCSGEFQTQIIDLLWNACWAKGEDLGNEKTLEEILNNAGYNGKKFLEKTFEKEVKQEIKNNTKEAIDNHVFGVPSFIYNHELYWGNDSLLYLELALQNKTLDWDKELFKDRIQDVML